MEAAMTAFVSSLLGIIISGLGLILILVIQVLIIVASFQDFINIEIVSKGWVIVRDICNMFFVVILMVIAFGTILRLENYSYKKWLPRLILMAVLINFSKTICGLLIDAAQIVMLTFVNAFKDVGGANFTEVLGLSKILTLANNDGGDFWTVVGAYMLGLIYLLVAIVVITTMVAVLVMRLVMIWIYVILSPAAYLLSAFPGGQKYASQWWSEFIKSLIVGPVLAFFIWLSLASLSPAFNDRDSLMDKELGQYGREPLGASEGTSPSALINFVVAIGLMIGGLKIAQEIGGAAGGMAGKGMSKLQKGGAFVGGYALGKAKATGASIGRGARNTAILGVSKAAQGIGKDMKGDMGAALRSAGAIGLAWRGDMQDKVKKEKQEKRQKFLEKMGMGEKTMAATSDFLKTDSGKATSTAAHTAAVGAAVGNAALGPVGGVAGAVVGGIAGWVGSKFAGKKKEEWKNEAEARKNASDGFYDLAANATDPDQQAIFMKKGDQYAKSAKHYAWSSKTAGTIQAFTSETTQKAAAAGSKDIANAKQNVKNAADDVDDFMADSNRSTFYSTGGKAPAQFFRQLTNDDNPKAGPARQQMEDWVRRLGTGGTAPTEHDIGVLKGLAKGIAASKKGGIDVSSLSGLISAINSQNGLVSPSGKGMQGKTVAAYESSVIAYRATGQEGEQGSGELALNTLAKNTNNDPGKNIVGVDFGKLKQQGVDIDAAAEGANVGGASLVNIANALIQQIDTEKTQLAAARANGEIEESEYNSRNAELDQARQRLSDPAQLDNLSLVNTASKNYGRQERMATVYHEEIHQGGVEDDELAERMSSSLMENNLYGRNAQTGGRHASELAGMAQKMKTEGMSNDDIMKNIDEEIKARVQAEGSNQAERVLEKEEGRKETESEAAKTADSGQAETASLSTDELQKNIDELAKKFKSIDLGAPGLIKPVGTKDGVDSFLMKTMLKKVAATNSHLIDRLSTPLEVEVLIKNAAPAKDQPAS